jgi:hypothetical protein
MKPIDHIDEIVRDAFGLWITGLFGAIGACKGLGELRS